MLSVLKFAKFNNKTEELIYKNNTYGSVSNLLIKVNGLGYHLNLFKEYNINIIKLIYGKVQSGRVYDYPINSNRYIDIDYIKESLRTEQNAQNINELKTIIKWAESIK